jgi:exodeoxyribonuclease V gamma subunit
MDGPRSSILPLLRGGSGARGRVTSLRHALRAFFDHAALSASGREAEPHRALQLLGDRDAPEPETIVFDALSAEEARRYLGGLVRELLSRRHAYLMPCESVLRLADRWGEVRGEDLVASVEEVRDRWDGGQSRFGPVRDAIGYPALAPGEAEDAAERRFGLFFRSIRDAGGAR